VLLTDACKYIKNLGLIYSIGLPLASPN